MFPGALGPPWWLSRGPVWGQSREPMWGLYELLVREAWLRARRRRKRIRTFLWVVGILLVATAVTSHLNGTLPTHVEFARSWINGVSERRGYVRWSDWELRTNLIFRSDAEESEEYVRWLD